MHQKNKPFEFADGIWSTFDVKYISKTNPEVLPENTLPDVEIQYIDIGSVSSEGTIQNTTNYRFEDAPSRARRIVRKGDTIISTVRTYLKAIATIGEENDGKICSTGFAIIRPHTEYVLPDFISYVCRSTPFVDEVMSNSVGISYPAINASQLGDIEIPVPSKTVQQAIVTFLDYKTARIDELIADKEKLIELLKEKRQSIISEAVTKGLDPTVPMKDSGVEWIGQIPMHWVIKPLFVVATENREKNIGSKCDNLLSLSYGKIIEKDIETNFGLLPESFEAYQIVHEGYTILRLTDLQNDKRSLRTGYVSEKGIITSAYVGLIPDEQIDSKFLANLLNAYDLMKIFYSLGNGVRQSMNYRDMKRLLILLPPKKEQFTISSYLATETKKIDVIIGETEKQVALLKEYRQSVISEVVTGKVKIIDGGIA